MYSNLKNVQILVAMLKSYQIDTIVVSPGNSHNAIVRSLECDSFFKTYNVVDERSAAFFAIGLIEKLKKPVAICCTSGTAASNYLTGVTEASRRELPLVVITGDKNPYYLGQYEDQVIDEISIFQSVVRYSCQLPMVKDDKDFWYCNRIINEALLELDHHGTGPVQIDVPIEQGMLAIGADFSESVLPKVTTINRISVLSSEDKWKELLRNLNGKKVMLFCGQDDHISEIEKKLINEIANTKHYVFAIDKISNLQGVGTLEITGAVKMNELHITSFTPDILISFAGNTTLDYKFKLKGQSSAFQHWIVNRKGNVADPFKNLSNIIEANTVEFLEMLLKYGGVGDSSYKQMWKASVDAYKIPPLEYSNLYSVSQLMKKIPGNSSLHLANSTTIRLAQYCELNDDVQVYCNRGVNGIDGCMSAFVGHAAASQNMCYLIIGDLTFFYDMNGLWNRYVGKNVRIMLNNNEGAALFHFNQGLKNYPTINENVAAEHFATARGWVESLGIKYITAHNKKEFDERLNEFLSDSIEGPILFEVFTKKEDDARIQHEFYDSIRLVNVGDALKENAKQAIKSIIGQKMVDRLKGNI